MVACAVVPATLEAEAGESFKPGRWRLQSAEITALHSSLGNSGRIHLKKKKGGVPQVMGDESPLTCHLREYLSLIPFLMFLSSC